MPPPSTDVSETATTACAIPGADVESSLWFLDEINEYKTVKPYILAFMPQDEDFPRSNFQRRECPNVLIRDLRSPTAALTFESSGFKVLPIESSVSFTDGDNPERLRSLYFEELQRCLKRDFGCNHVEIVGHQVRKRHETFPVSTGGLYKHRQPVRMAHVDVTPKFVTWKIRSSVSKLAAESILKSRFIYANVWKPLNGPIRDWPLALCDASTIDPSTDLEKSDLVYENVIEENFQVYHRPYHKWYYLNDQTSSEAFVFRQYDSKLGFKAPGVPHASFSHPLATGNEKPRESIEVNVVLWWD